MVRARGVLLVFAALLVGASYTIAAPDTSADRSGRGTAMSAPVVRSERAVLVPVTESRSLPTAALLGVLTPAAVVAAALAGTFLRRLPSPRQYRVALQIPRLRGPPAQFSG
jgi:hypothetical protein